MTDWIDAERDVVFQNYGRQPIVLERGEGTRVWDVDGREYLDFVGGLAVNVLGHSHPVVARAVADQAGTLIHTSNLYYTKPMIELAQLLVANSTLDRVLFLNSGAEAIEAAIKLARRWGHDERGGAHHIISFNNGFHGRTFGALAATGTARYREPFEPLPAGFSHVDWNDLEAVKKATTDQTVAILLEPIQGEGGVNMPDDGFLPAIQAWCRENNLLLVLDEIQTGNGRTGTLFAYEQYGLDPDIVCLAKGLAGGVPIGAILARDKLAAHLVPGDHGTTFGANPLAAAAGVATMRHIIDEELPQRATQASERIRERIAAIEDRVPMVTGLRGLGLLLAITLAEDVSADVVVECRERGLLANNVRPNAVRLMPPLNVTDEEIDRACQIFEEAVAAVVAARA
ncbi:MAG: acetylornithine transaminase [Dehalococcoidia bacterium]|nr:acetylornithine transaminase [Dehalococcoidia bacterium]